MATTIVTGVDKNITPITCYWRKCRELSEMRIQTKLGVGYYCPEHGKKFMEMR